MTIRLVEATEWRTTPAVLLSTTERDLLATLVPSLRLAPSPGSTDRYDLTPGSHVGVVRVGDVQLQIQPKIGAAQVLALASYALDPKAWRDQPATLDPYVGLAEAAIPALAQLTRAALRRGLLQGYRTVDDQLMRIRGRVNFALQQRQRPGLALPVDVTFDDYDHDTLEHRLFRAAATGLSQLRVRHEHSRRELIWLRQQLQEISDTRFDPHHVPEPVWTRLNERYRPAVNLARLILSGAIGEARTGHHDVAAFVVDMNVVFEGFVRACLMDHLQLTQRQFPTGRRAPATYLDVERNVKLEPDLSWWVDGECVFVGDCKYKRPVGAIPNADIYQMHAYLTALQLRQGLLVYASGEEMPPAATIVEADRSIEVASIDLSRSLADLIADVGVLSELIRARLPDKASV